MIRSLTLSLFAIFFAVVAEAEQAHVTVIGQGQISVVPDMANITMGVTTQGKTASDALDENSVLMSGVIAALKGADIAGKDIQTTNLNLQPIWNHRQNNGEAPKIEGYRAMNNLTVHVRELDDLGAILDIVTKTGANNFNGLQFDITDRKGAMDKARITAILDARAKAELYATAAGVTLGDVIEISEILAQSAPRNMRMAEAMSASAVPVSEGTLDVNASVKVIYTLGN
jgi:uncharacterized protein YggE